MLGFALSWPLALALHSRAVLVDTSHQVVTIKAKHKPLVPGAQHLGCEVGSQSEARLWGMEEVRASHLGST